MKIYVVMAQSFSYNDESYYAEDGGSPIKAFSSEEEAEAHCEEVTDSWFRNTAPDELAAHLSNHIDYNEAEEAAKNPTEIRKLFAEHTCMPYHVVSVLYDDIAPLESNDFES